MRPRPQPPRRSLPPFLSAIGLWSAFFVLAYLFRAPLQKAFYELERDVYPCRRPIAYSIGTLDKRFGITKADLLKAIGEAEQIWEGPFGRQLFAYADDGPLKVDLIYDFRQQATDKLDSLGITIDQNEAGYDKLKAKYTALQKAFTSQKSAFERAVSAYDARRRAYEAEIAAINRKGGARPEQFAMMQQQRAEIDAEADRLNKEQAMLNGTIDTLNDMVTVLNRLAAALNLQTIDYNTISLSRGRTFEEGVYVHDATGDRIEIYQFDDPDMLVRVLAHELGHALGIGHVEDPSAIMHRLNRSVNEKLTANDLAALKQACASPWFTE